MHDLYIDRKRNEIIEQAHDQSQAKGQADTCEHNLFKLPSALLATQVKMQNQHHGHGANETHADP